MMRRQTSLMAGFLLLVAAPTTVPTIAAAQSSPSADPSSVPQPAAEQTVDVAPPVVAPPPVVDTAPPVAKPPVKPPAKPPVVAAKKKGPVDSLKPGQFVWEKRAYNAQNVRIVAVLDIQRLYVFDGDTLVAVSTMSSGKKGHPTPVGQFEILQKNIDHKSNLYSNAPMPYMQRLTWDGIALHAGHIPGYPASHGCLRLPLSFAKALYSVTKMKQSVTILADLNTPAPKPEPVAEPVPDVKVDPSVPVEPQPQPQPQPKLEAEPVAKDPVK